MLIDLEKCDGCGACVDHCPVGAAYLVEGMAVIDPEICQQCETCIEVCPAEAITAGVPAPVPVPAPVCGSDEMVVSSTATVLARPSLARRVAPWAGLALAVVGREVVPRLADALLAAVERRLERRTASSPLSRPGAPPDGQGDQHVSLTVFHSVSVRWHGLRSAGHMRRKRKRG